MRLGRSGLALVAAAATFAVSVAVAQNLPPPSAALQPAFAVPPFKNLKVFPKDVSRAELLSNMKFFSQSLGVRCTFCHVGEEGKPLSTFDFASDTKEKKQTARKMLAMAHRINEENFAAEDPGVLKVTCFTCHRGSTKPLTRPPDPAVPAPAADKPTG
jgi:Photosynthetic reaction centre cytochrome C subunit